MFDPQIPRSHPCVNSNSHEPDHKSIADAQSGIDAGSSAPQQQFVADVQILISQALALSYRILPVGLDKRPLIRSWKFLQDRSPTPQELESWRGMNPPAWAVVTGAASGIVVLDFDGPFGRSTLPSLSLSPHVLTGSGGYHVYFEHPGWHVPTVNGKSKQKLGELYPGLDVRADGGYAIFAGRSSSGEYRWLRRMQPEPLIHLPHGLREMLGLRTPPSPTPHVANGRSRLTSELLRRALSQAGIDGRNNAGFWLALQLRDNGYSEADADEVMQQFVRQVPDTNAKGQLQPYTLQEARQTLRQAYSRSWREPWDKHVNGTPPAPAAQHHELPTIEASNRELRDLTRDALTALQRHNNPPYLFARSGQMVQVVADELGRHAIREVTESSLRGCLTRSANFRRVWLDRGGHRTEAAVSPPLDVVKDILALSAEHWKLPPLESISEAPILRCDGTIVNQPGYDSRMRIVYAPQPRFRSPAVPDSPTTEQVDYALTLLHEMLEGFPFVDHASRANGLAMLLTPLLRRAINGNVPIALIDAPARGTGKSLLAELLAIIHTGNNAAMQPAPIRDEEEWRKVITSVLANGHPLTIFDNVAYRLDSPNLALAVTAAVWSDRVLGHSKMITLPQQTCFVATGNNILLGGDLPRRCYWIRLDAQTSNPWQRTGFRIPDLKGWALERRGDLIAALLTIARAWYASGCPDGDAPVLGSFETWSRTVSGILRPAGVIGFLENLEDLYDQSDPTEAQWQAFLTAVHEAASGDDFTVAELVTRIRSDHSLHALLPDDLVDDDRSGNHFPRKVGNAFRARVDRRFGPEGVHLKRVGNDKSTKVMRWRVEFQSCSLIS